MITIDVDVSLISDVRKKKHDDANSIYVVVRNKKFVLSIFLYSPYNSSQESQMVHYVLKNNAKDNQQS
jgi:hypothetical protein